MYDKFLHTFLKRQAKVVLSSFWMANVSVVHWFKPYNYTFKRRASHMTMSCGSTAVNTNRVLIMFFVCCSAKRPAWRDVRGVRRLRRRDGVEHAVTGAGVRLDGFGDRAKSILLRTTARSQPKHLEFELMPERRALVDAAGDTGALRRPPAVRGLPPSSADEPTVGQ